MKWLMRIVVFGGLLLVGRELHLRQTELTAVAGEIDVQRDAIDRAEVGLEDLEREVGAADDAIRLLDQRITAIERRHPRGVPPSEYEGYRRLVRERNDVASRQRALVERQRALVEEYGRHVDAHNTHVDEATALARRGTPGSVVRDVWDRLVGGE